MYENEDMFKEELLSEGSNIKSDKLEERVVIRIKRKGRELPASLIYFKKPNRGILEGEFFKHVETTELEEAENEKKIEVDTLSYFFKNKQFEFEDKTEDSSISHKKRKHLSLKNYESDLEGTINKLKKCKVTNQTVQVVDVSGVKKRLKLIDVDLADKEKGIVVNKERHEEEKDKDKDRDNVCEEKSDAERVTYDFYVLDDEKLSIEKYMDYFYDIKHANVYTGDILLLDDMYGNTLEEYVNESFNPSVCSETSSFKELSDYPEETSTDEHYRNRSSSEKEDEEDEEEDEDEDEEDEIEEDEIEEREHSNNDVNEYESEEFYTYGNYDTCTYPEDVILLEPPEDDDMSCYRDPFYDEQDEHVEDEVDEVEWEDFDIEGDDEIIRSNDALAENKYNDSIVASKDDRQNAT